MSDNYGKDPRARTYAGWIAALEIFAKYAGGLQRWMPTNAEHDILYLLDKPKPVNVEDGEDGENTYEWASAQEKADAETLDALAFHWDVENDCWAKFT